MVRTISLFVGDCWKFAALHVGDTGSGDEWIWILRLPSFCSSYFCIASTRLCEYVWIRSMCHTWLLSTFYSTAVLRICIFLCFSWILSLLAWPEKIRSCFRQCYGHSSFTHHIQSDKCRCIHLSCDTGRRARFQNLQERPSSRAENSRGTSVQVSTTCQMGSSTQKVVKIGDTWHDLLAPWTFGFCPPVPLLTIVTSRCQIYLSINY